MNRLTQGSRSHFSHILLRTCISHTFFGSQGKSPAHRQALVCQTRWLFALAGLQEDGGDTTLGQKEKQGSWDTLNAKAEVSLETVLYASLVCEGKHMHTRVHVCPWFTCVDVCVG